ncbi:acyltransferase domain-containing protein [Nocardia sp. NPDC056000]|uniref:acyltransferase domain-containing protein n=1 Tax=Nocardia sp. NPDC056000 TaxID=3345674 RepID=UPI0035D777CA
MSIVGVAYRPTGTAFDNDWFALPEHEAAALDPRQRVTLELAVEALDDSGLGHLAPGSRAAVVFGAATTFGPAAALNIAHLLSRTLDLHGPSLLVASDRTAPLVAVDTAVRLLADESVPFVITGGADLALLPDPPLPQHISAVALPESSRGAVLILQRTRDAYRTGSRHYAEFPGTGMGFPHPGDTAPRIALWHSHPRSDETDGPVRTSDRDTQPPLPIPLSAHDLDALHELCLHYATAIGGYPSLRDFAAAVARLTPGPSRATILAHDITDAASQLREVARDITALATTLPVSAAARVSPRVGRVQPNRIAHLTAADAPAAASAPTSTTAQGNSATRPESNGSAGPSTACGIAGEMVRRVVGSALSSDPGTAESGEVVGISEYERAGGVLFLFSGAGGHARMGRALAARYPVFAAALTDAVDAIVAAGGPRVWTPRNGFGSGTGGEDVAQPALFAFQVALAALLGVWGIWADAVAGHGIGEVAAAVVCGAISLADGARIAVARGRLLAGTGIDGAAAVLEATPAEVHRLIEPMRSSVGVAAVDGPSSITVSGDPRYIDTLVRRAHRRAIFAQRIAADGTIGGPIPVPHAPRARDVAPQLVSELATVAALRPEMPFFSTTRRGMVIGPKTAPGANGVVQGCTDAAYWALNAAGPVELGAALDSAAGAGISTVVEIGPHGVLTPVAREHMAFRGAAYAVGSRADEAGSFLRAVGRLFLEGRRVDWSALGALTVPPPQRRWGRRVSVEGVGVRMPEVRIRVDGTYVVAGGLGVSGALVVRWLLDAGVREVVVLTRLARALPEPLEGMEECVVVVQCDATDRVDLAGALDDIRDSGPPIRGVVLAGRALHPVAAGNLVDLTAADPTDFTIGFSGVGWLPLTRVSGGAAPVTRE